MQFTPALKQNVNNS